MLRFVAAKNTDNLGLFVHRRLKLRMQALRSPLNTKQTVQQFKVCPRGRGDLRGCIYKVSTPCVFNLGKLRQTNEITIICVFSSLCGEGDRTIKRPKRATIVQLSSLFWNGTHADNDLQRRSRKYLRQSDARAAVLLEGVEISLSITIHSIPFHCFREEVKNVSIRCQGGHLCFPISQKNTHTL